MKKKPTYSCPIDNRCGGCSWLRVPYGQQLARKQQHVDELFADLIDDGTQCLPILGMKVPLHYRNKVVSPFVGIYDKRTRRRRILCGMYERGTHWVIDSSECLIENAQAKAIILTIRDLMPKFRIEPYDEDRDEGFLRHAQVRVGHNSGEVMVTLVTRTEQFPTAKKFVRALVSRHPEITTVVQNVNSRKTNVIMGDKERKLYGPGFILDTLCGLSFRISSTSFYQVNSTQTEVLYSTAIRMAKLTGTETVMDAYCGTGTIGLVAVRGINGEPGAAKLIGVEERADAVADARNNARHNGIDNAEFVAADAGAYMREQAEQGRSVDVLFMDPPRAGSTPDFLKAACSISPKRIVYISCNPTTQARDAKYLIEHGYRIDVLQPVDMFPHTDHVECVISMSRSAL
ncbi:23S rRNA (uracil-C(5))-methyltransferase RlmCD [Slackia heliotrinireducens]|uniref:23S rRNA (Uracil-5-)-methyltransferase RumA n=1 Tax=Slackia heliotrinireducens (strain ATCC 29202 / DSM 20476 / NCTC 11029 / RHS 1) TaxID=471855 RepID=C7N354_SLAHD|nr:23S rRNA (uracil(1939)-C(5))-methyltransferase RlmD [Slackia heliotrinireducens]ACV21575.1 23S rRNA (uracil-5-)-methyltransferase RumA [Slackia heliotrinireducens DSM 20476]VEG99090.1 23S rRNA (uracil-C(5))-methyltransferase RlmCD [Slackia heliotrinireducens]